MRNISDKVENSCWQFGKYFKLSRCFSCFLSSDVELINTLPKIYSFDFIHLPTSSETSVKSVKTQPGKIQSKTTGDELLI